MKYGVIVIIFITISIIALSGCTSPSEKLANSTNKPSLEPTATSQPTQSNIEGSSLFNLFALNWFEYEDVADTHHFTHYQVTNDTYNGKNAYHIKSIHQYKSANQQPIYDIYYDIEGNALGGHAFYQSNVGGTSENKDYSALEAMYQEKIVCGAGVWVCEFVGKEPVTVPAGYFPNASKYSCYFPYVVDNTLYKIRYTFWYDPSMPIPIQVATNDDSVWALTGWG